LTIAKGRNLQVEGETFVWRISKARGRLTNSSAKTANFTAQHGSRGSMLTAKLTSKLWTEEHEWNLDCAPWHKAAFTPDDARSAILAAQQRGWKPRDKGTTFRLEGVEFADYRC